MKKLLITTSMLIAILSFVFVGCGTNTTEGVYVMTKITCKSSQQDIKDAINSLNKNVYTIRLTEDGVITQLYFDTEVFETKSLNAVYRIKSSSIQCQAADNSWEAFAKIKGSKITFEYKVGGNVIYVAEYTKNV